MSNYRSLLSPYIERFLEYREALFHANSAYIPVLKSLDSFCFEQYPHVSSLTKEMVIGWLEKSHNHGRISRGSVVRKFALYINGIGGTAYVLPDRMYSGKSSFVPYIFSDSELSRLFSEIDKIKSTVRNPFAAQTLPVLFRLIYTCGLRPNEGRLLKTQNIYFDTGEILITETKGKKERIVVMSEDMRNLCIDYKEHFPYLTNNEYFFPTSEGQPMSNTFILSQFRKCWRKANPHIHPNELPTIRVYDLRHRFVSASVQRWLDMGVDVNAKLPYLRAYLGHSTLSQTAYYLHMLPENLTTGSALNLGAFEELIPEAEGYDC